MIPASIAASESYCLVQARTESATAQQECMQLRKALRAGQAPVQTRADPAGTWLARSLSKAMSPRTRTAGGGWRRSSSGGVPEIV